MQVGSPPPLAARGQLLTAGAMDAQNELGKPPQVVPQAFEARAADGRLTLKLPAKSVLVVALEG